MHGHKSAWCQLGRTLAGQLTARSDKPWKSTLRFFENFLSPRQTQVGPVVLAALGSPKSLHADCRLPASPSLGHGSRCRPTVSPLKSPHTGYIPPQALSHHFMWTTSVLKPLHSNHRPSPLEPLHCRPLPIPFHHPRASSSEKAYTYLIPPHGPATSAAPLGDEETWPLHQMFATSGTRTPGQAVYKARLLEKTGPSESSCPNSPSPRSSSCSSCPCSSALPPPPALEAEAEKQR